MKARIYNNQFAGLHNSEWLNNNQEKVIGGELVSEWELTDILPNETLLKPIWNILEWIEGATAEEIEQSQNQEKENFVRAFMAKKALDGQTYASEIRFKITKDLIGKPIAEVNEIDSQFQTTVMPLLQLVEGVGADWWSAMNRAFTTTEPTNAIALAYFNEVKAYIVNYVQTNYPTEL
jgi:hypothetical protein